MHSFILHRTHADSSFYLLTEMVIQQKYVYLYNYFYQSFQRQFSSNIATQLQLQ